jgi:hypothetical protein
MGENIIFGAWGYGSRRPLLRQKPAITELRLNNYWQGEIWQYSIDGDAHATSFIPLQKYQLG